VRVLVLSYEAPAYPGGGGQTRQHCLLEPLAATHDIRVVTTDVEPAIGRPPAGVDIHRIDPGPPLGPVTGPWLAKNAAHYLRGRPWLHVDARHHVAALAAALPGHLGDFRPDVIQIEHGELGGLLALVPRPRVLVLHNLLTTVQRQLGRPLEVAVMARQERRDMAAADAVVVVTEADARRARRLRRRAAISVVPNCVPAAHLRRTGPEAERPTVVMTASWHYQPNQQAAVELLAEVLPAVRRRVPEAELVLVGQRLPDWLARLVEASPGARAVGPVADVRPELHRAWVAVAPLRTGSGSPLKALEAMAAGIPVVATPRVIDALGLGPDDGVVGGDLATAISDLLADADRRRQVGQAGRLTVERRFDATVVAPLQAEVWRSVAARA
jgi:glycosyltransferase involved in cell wall biosynthesis